jgi:hypothetical protein
LRKFLNRVLRKSGYQIVRISKFLELLESRFKRCEDFTFVQIGANELSGYRRLPSGWDGCEFSRF